MYRKTQYLIEFRVLLLELSVHVRAHNLFQIIPNCAYEHFDKDDLIHQGYSFGLSKL